MHGQSRHRAYQFGGYRAKLRLGARDPAGGQNIAALPGGGVAARGPAFSQAPPQAALGQQRGERIPLAMRGGLQHDGRALPLHGVRSASRR